MAWLIYINNKSEKMHNIMLVVHSKLTFSSFYLRNCQKVIYFALVFEKK